MTIAAANRKKKGKHAMKIPILNGSPRPGGNTEIMADAFRKGTSEAGHEVTQINLAGK